MAASVAANASAAPERKNRLKSCVREVIACLPLCAARSASARGPCLQVQSAVAPEEAAAVKLIYHPLRSCEVIDFRKTQQVLGADAVRRKVKRARHVCLELQQARAVRYRLRSTRRDDTRLSRTCGF